jgi:hypothetical protein
METKKILASSSKVDKALTPGVMALRIIPKM